MLAIQKKRTGSNPALSAIFCKNDAVRPEGIRGRRSQEQINHAPMAQLDRAPDYESGCRKFESCWAHQTITGG
jgi:hypothetical protein